MINIVRCFISTSKKITYQVNKAKLLVMMISSARKNALPTGYKVCMKGHNI